jgi:hypothetical protein
MVQPANAANKAVTWSSDHPEVATVDADGSVTAVAEGVAKITVSTLDGAKTAFANVLVLSDTNLARDPGFETGNFSVWTSHWNNSAITATNARTGTYAARLTTQFGGIEQNVTGLTPNTAYKLTAWVKSADGGSGVLQVKFYGSYDREITVNSTDYTKYELSFTTGNANTGVTLSMYKRSAAGALYFDDFELLQNGLPQPLP